jgi:NADH-quinone oxidoreductase subunit E
MQSIEMISEKVRSEIKELMARYPAKRAVLLFALHAIRRENQMFTPDDYAELAEILDEHPAEIQSTAEFYDMFITAKPAKCAICVCTSASCQLRGSDEIVKHLKDKLGIDFGMATPDAMFSLEEVECIGACDMAPAIMLNDETMGPMSVEKIDEVLESCRRKSHLGGGSG